MPTGGFIKPSAIRCASADGSAKRDFGGGDRAAVPDGVAVRVDPASESSAPVVCLGRAGLVGGLAVEDEDVRPPLLLVQADTTSIPRTIAVSNVMGTGGKESRYRRTWRRCGGVVKGCSFVNAGRPSSRRTAELLNGRII